MHPKFETWLKAVDEKSALVRRSIRAVLIVVAVTAGYLWYEHVYRLPKLQYNQVHPYTSWIPITAFLILRNMTPSMRLNSMGLYGWLGCITLETCTCRDFCSNIFFQNFCIRADPGTPLE